MRDDADVRGAAIPEALRDLMLPGDVTWEAFARESQRLGAATVDVLFLSFLRRLGRFGYFTFGPITVDIRMVEEIVERTIGSTPPDVLNARMDRFVQLLVDEVRQAGRTHVDDLHVLLAFLKLRDGLPGRIFGEMGVTPAQVESFVRSGGERSVPAERLYSPEEAAEYLGVHVQTVRAWIRSGRLRASRLAGQRALRIRASDLQSVLEPVEPGQDL